MVTFAETTQVSHMELREPTCLTATLSPGLRRKKMLWQNAVKHIIIQQELSAQVTDYPTVISRSVASRWKLSEIVLFIFPDRIMRIVCAGTDMASSEPWHHFT